MMQLPMTWDEIKMRARDGASRLILADLNGVAYTTFCKWLEQQESIHGEKIVFNNPKNDNRQKSSSAEKKERNEAIVKDYAEGKTMKEVAAKYGVTPATVLNVLRKYREKGLVPERKKQEPKQEAKPEPAETKSDLDEDLLTELCRICAEHEKNYELAAAGIMTLENQMEKERKIIQQLKTMMGGKT